VITFLFLTSKSPYKGKVIDAIRSMLKDDDQTVTPQDASELVREVLVKPENPWRRAGIQAARNACDRCGVVRVADQQGAVVQDAVAGYRLIKLVAAMPTSTVYAIDTIVAEMTILSIFGSLTREHSGIYSRAP
jgi:hypothetical protein